MELPGIAGVPCQDAWRAIIWKLLGTSILCAIVVLPETAATTTLRRSSETSTSTGSAHGKPSDPSGTPSRAVSTSTHSQRRATLEPPSLGKAFGGQLGPRSTSEGLPGRGRAEVLGGSSRVPRRDELSAGSGKRCRATSAASSCDEAGLEVPCAGRGPSTCRLTRGSPSRVRRALRGRSEP